MKHLRLFYRGFVKNLTTSILSVLSLSVGIAVVLLLGTWIYKEFQFDKQHPDSEQIYRVCRKGFINNESVMLGSVFAPLGVETQQKFPEVADMVRIYRFGSSSLSVDDQIYNQNNIYLADNTFFNFFRFDINQSAIERFKAKPNTIILTDELAVKLFGTEDPIGKTVHCQGAREVVGVIKDADLNTHLDFTALMPIQSVDWVYKKGWGTSDSYSTYLRLADNTDVKDLEKKITKLAVTQVPFYEKIKLSHFLQPLRDIHFSSDFRFDFVKKNSIKLIYTFMAVAVVILLLAIVNFINLFVSTSFSRAKVIGIRKANGATKRHLIYDFFIETFFYVVFSVLMGGVLAQFALPLFNKIVEYRLVISIKEPFVYLFITSLIVLITLTAGSYPAYEMSRLAALKILKDQFSARKISVIQKTLIVTQFTASIVLLISIFVIKSQLSFMLSTDLGFDKEHVLYLKMNDAFAKQSNRIMQDLEQNRNVLDVTVKEGGTPIDWTNGSPISLANQTSEQVITEVCEVRDDYFDFFKMPILQGENIVEGEAQNSCVINEETVRVLNLKDPIGKFIVSFGKKYRIKGVVRNAYTKSLHETVDPQVYLPILRKWYGHSTLFVKTTGNSQEVIKYLKTEWEKLNPTQPFHYKFLDDSYEQLYKAEAKAGKVVSWAVLVALIITIAGLWGVATYAITRRTKEVGIRKVNGARIGEILMMLNRDFIIWISLSSVIACPIAVMIMNRWLESFSLKTSMHWWVFVLACLIPFVIGVFAVSWKSWKVAAENPIKALRYE